MICRPKLILDNWKLRWAFWYVQLKLWYMHRYYAMLCYALAVIWYKILYKIIWLVRAFWLVNKCVFIALWRTKMAWAMWLTVSSCENYSFMKELKLYKRFLLVVFLFVKPEANNFIKEIKKHVIRAFIACWKRRQSFWEFSSTWKSSTASGVFTDLPSNSRKRSSRILTGYESTEKMFYFLNGIVWYEKRNNLLNERPVKARQLFGLFERMYFFYVIEYGSDDSNI